MEVTEMFEAMVGVTSAAEDATLEDHLAEWINKRGNRTCVDDLRAAALEDTDLVEPL